MRTNKNVTFNLLNKFKEDGEFNIEKLVDSVRHLIYLNEDAFYAQTKRDKKVEEIAYTQLLYYLNEKLQHKNAQKFIQYFRFMLPLIIWIGLIEAKVCRHCNNGQEGGNTAQLTFQFCAQKAV